MYANYPADLCEYAESIEKDNTNQYFFALKVLEKHAGENEKKSAIAGDADFRQPMAHRAVDFKIAMDRNNRINQMAEEESLFSRYFPKRMMKYGSKIGFFRETHSRKKEYLESDYGSFNAKVSLPIRFLSDPIDYYQRRENYLKDRLRNYEADC